MGLFTVLGCMRISTLSGLLYRIPLVTDISSRFLATSFIAHSTHIRRLLCLPAHGIEEVALMRGTTLRVTCDFFEVLKAMLDLSTLPMTLNLKPLNP